MPRQYGHSKKALREYKKAEDRIAALKEEARKRSEASSTAK